jgi:hypothetical protein
MKQIKPAAPTRTAPQGLPAPLLCPLVWLVAGPADLSRAVLAWELSHERNSSTPSQRTARVLPRALAPRANEDEFFAAKKESNAHPLTGDSMEIHQAAAKAPLAKTSKARPTPSVSASGRFIPPGKRSASPPQERLPG